MEIAPYEFTGEGMCRVYENERWTVSIKDWKPANDVAGLDMLERYNGIDEPPVLLSGSCILIPAEELENGWTFDEVEMQPRRVYNIPCTPWHNIVTQRDTKMILIENSNTRESNSDFHRLAAKDLKAIRQLMQSKQL